MASCHFVVHFGVDGGAQSRRAPWYHHHRRTAEEVLDDHCSPPIGELVQSDAGKRLRRAPDFLTTHSESIVRQLNTAELYLVSKVGRQNQGKPRRIGRCDKPRLPLDTAWLANLFDGAAMVKVGLIVEGESENWWWSRRCFSSGCTTMIAPLVTPVIDAKGGGNLLPQHIEPFIHSPGRSAGVETDCCPHRC